MSSSEHRKPAPPSFAALVQSFFAEHLTQQRALSPQTVAAYRDAFVLFLDFAQAKLHKTPTTLSLADLTPALILDFLDSLLVPSTPLRTDGSSIRPRRVFRHPEARRL